MNKYTRFIVTGIVVMIASGLLYFKFNQQRGSGTVIILNGPSSAGKSSIQKEFQFMMMPNLWIKLGVDNLFDKPMPDITLDNLSFWQSENPIRWVSTDKDKDENAVVTLFTGDQGDQVAYGMNSAIVEYAKNGNNIIVDYIAYKKEWIDDLQRKLEGIKTYWVKVEIPLSVIEERETARGTSPKGHARSHYDTVHWGIEYDFSVHSDTDSAETIAEQIKEFLQSHIFDKKFA